MFHLQMNEKGSLPLAPHQSSCDDLAYLKCRWLITPSILLQTLPRHKTLHLCCYGYSIIASFIMHLSWGQESLLCAVAIGLQHDQIAESPHFIYLQLLGSADSHQPGCRRWLRGGGIRSPLFWQQLGRMFLW